MENKTQEQKQTFFVVGGKWFDKVNGNTYHNAKIINAETGEQFFTGFAYGYGSAYLESAREFIKNNLRFDNFKIIDGGSFHTTKRDCKNGNF